MANTLRNVCGDAGSLSNFAVGVLLFIGVLTIVGEFLGRTDALVSESVYYLGVAALLVLVVTVARAAAVSLLGGDSDK